MLIASRQSRIVSIATAMMTRHFTVRMVGQATTHLIGSWRKTVILCCWLGSAASSCLSFIWAVFDLYCPSHPVLACLVLSRCCSLPLLNLHLKQSVIAKVGNRRLTEHQFPHYRFEQHLPYYYYQVFCLKWSKTLIRSASSHRSEHLYLVG